MIFIYQNWERFCRALAEQGMVSIPMRELAGREAPYLVLKHDIENTVPRAYELAKIEQKYGHRGTYYAHAYLLDDPKNVELLRQMQSMGHEVSYHYDVMDSSHGDLEQAMAEFETNRQRFESLGFSIVTVCQHGNPVVERVGYTSNRDFFRSPQVQEKYPAIVDVMVNLKTAYHTDYAYFSDAGRKFRLIYDPINDDRISSEEKNIPYEDLDALMAVLSPDSNAIISTHPHRWTSSAFEYLMKEKTFKAIKGTAKVLMKIPICKKIMSRYYYLAKMI